MKITAIFFILSMIIKLVLLQETSDVESRAANKDTRLYHVSLLNKFHKHYCGGAIIRNNWIITAAPCSFVCGEELMCAVRYGTQDLNDGRYAPIRIFAVNPDYDVALAEAPLIIQGLVKPILINTYSLPRNTVLSVVGWRWEKAPRSCYKRLRRMKFNRIDCQIDRAICAVAADKNLCFGDYGGPLVYQNKLVGVSNFGLIENVTVSDTDEVEDGEDAVENNGFNYISNVYLRSYIDSNENRNKTQHPRKRIQSSIFQKLHRSSPSSENETERSIGTFRRCYPGYGVFAQLSFFTSWIEQTIKNYTEEFDLVNLPPSEEWTKDFIQANFDFANEC